MDLLNVIQLNRKVGLLPIRDALLVVRSASRFGRDPYELCFVLVLTSLRSDYDIHVNVHVVLYHIRFEFFHKLVALVCDS